MSNVEVSNLTSFIKKFLNYYLAMFDKDLSADFHKISKLMVLFSGNSLYSMYIDLNLMR